MEKSCSEWLFTVWNVIESKARMKVASLLPCGNIMQIVNCTLRAVICKNQVKPCKIEKSKSPKQCQLLKDLGVDDKDKLFQILIELG